VCGLKCTSDTVGCQMVIEIDLELIKDYARQNQLWFTNHAVLRMLERVISDVEVQEAIINGEIIEDYPEDKYGPSCLIYGKTQAMRPLHIQCSAPPRVRIITVYEPDPHEWVDQCIRREP
jgi:hypothetical protein